VLPSLVALAYRGLTTAVVVAAALLAYQQLENNYIQPRIFSKKLNVSPIATMIGVLVGGKLLGIVGVILAVPVVGMLPVLERVWFPHVAPPSELAGPQKADAWQGPGSGSAAA
jgi:predicted PurR-regulated permease PerM